MPVPADWSQQLKLFVDELKRNSRAEEYIGERPFPKFVLTEKAVSWEDFLRWVNELQGSWCFRGHRESEWLLITSLDRAVRRETPSGHHHLDRRLEQRELLFRFQQQARLYVRNPPLDDDLGSWLALMQHHGAPTTLLDWTKSPYVAAYFVFEERALGAEKHSALWAIDLDWLERKGQELLGPRVPELALDDPMVRVRQINSLLAQRHESDGAVIIKVDPLQSNERLATQQGVLLWNLFPEAFFFGALMRMMIHPETPDQPVVRKLEVEAGCRTEFLTNLRAMNIHRASLFPGIDGFARSLRLDVEIKPG
jgi:hypothetical protein